MKKNENKKINLNRYKDQGGLTLKKMNFGLWLSKNRKLFLRLTIAFLLIISAFFIIYSSYGYIKYFLAGKRNNNTTNGQDNVVSPRKITQNIVVSKINIFQNRANSDLVVKLLNPNKKFMATFSYCFVQAGKNLTCANSFILPNEEKYILSLGQNLSAETNQIKFILQQVNWRRINLRKMPDWSKFKNEHFNFSIQKLQFASATQSGLSDKIGLNTLNFVISNDSPYGFYKVPLNILLFNGSDLIGVNQYSITNFSADKKVAVKLVWPDRLARVTRTEIEPEINILDPSVYAKYTGTTEN